MTRKAILICAAIIIVLLLVGAGANAWFTSPGVHIVGRHANVKIDGYAYLFQFFTGEQVGESELHIDAWLDVAADVTAKGNISVGNYPIIIDEGKGQQIAFSATRKDGLWTAYYVGHWSEEMDNNPSTILPEEKRFSDYSYYLCFYENLPENMIVWIEGPDNFSVVAIPADSLEQAKVSYNSFFGRYVGDTFQPIE